MRDPSSAPRSARSRSWLPTVATTLALLVGYAMGTRLPAADLLGLAAALTVTLGAIRRPFLRAGLLVATLAGMGGLLLADVTAPATPSSIAGEVVIPWLLLVLVAVAGSALASALDTAHGREVEARKRAEDRARLLATVRQVSGTPGSAAGACARGLRGLGFDVVTVRRREREVMVPVHVDPTSGTSEPLSALHGLIGDALEEGRTQVASDHRADDRHATDLDLGCLIVTPIVVQGAVWGTLSAGRHAAGMPTDDDVETVEVMADHLSAALATDRLLANQRALLTRLHDLDKLRTSFVDRVSDDLRDPLTVVRGTAQTLAAHGDRLAAERRELLLRRLVDQAGELRGTVETLLDFSRGTEAGREPEPVPIDVIELLAPALKGSGVPVDVEERPVVVVDHALLRRAVELLRRAHLDPDAAIRIGRRDGSATVDLTLTDAAGLEGGFARSLAEQLIVAAGGRSERFTTGLRLVLPLAEEVAP